MSELPSDLSALQAMLASAGGSISLGQAMAELDKSVKTFRSFDPVETAAIFGGLLTVPGLQSNCIRLEGLAHIALVCCRGRKKPSAVQVGRWFSDFGEGWLGRMEDPAEDVFASNITTPRGNFRVIDGVWEAAGFYTQRMVNIVEGMPAGSGYDGIRDRIYALLALSDLVCERAAIGRNILGEEHPHDTLAAKYGKSIHAFKRRVRFSRAEMEGRGISWDALAEFAFNPRDTQKLAEESLGHSTLERYPLVADKEWLHLILPTAVTVAIRRFVIDRMIAGGMRDALAFGIGREYSALFSNIPILGGHIGAPVQFERREHGLISAIMIEIDVGRYLNLIFFVDILREFEKSGLVGVQPDLDALAPDIERAIDECSSEARGNPEFRGGISLVVGCGIGRGSILAAEDKPRADWRVEHLSAAAFTTLSWLKEFRPLSLWRLLDAHDQVEASGIRIANVNGLINLVAWARGLDGHIVPHGSISEDFADPAKQRLLVIEQNSLRTLRHDVATYWDVHAEKDVGGTWRAVRKDADSLFEEDRARPVYGTDERVGRWPQVVFPTTRRPWWGQVIIPEFASGDTAYQRMKMLMVWIARMAPVLEVTISSLPEGAVCLCGNFEGAIAQFAEPPLTATFEEALADISINCDKSTQTVTLTTHRRFEEAIFHPENIAERAFVMRALEGFATLSGKSMDATEREAVVSRIVPNTAARETHVFRVHQFRDEVRGSLPRTPLTIDSEDDAAFRFGLGWRVRSRDEGDQITGKEACTTYLNAMVTSVEDELSELLRQYDRRSMIEFALKNHESAAVERDWWNRTASAVLGLREDQNLARDTMARHEFRLAGAFQASRGLIEFAICECPLEGGLRPGKLDFSRLMARLAFIHHAGGWSDAIRWDVMEPRVRITPLGDIFVNFDFMDNILIPFGRAGSDLRVDNAVRDYPKMLDEPEPGPLSSAGLIDERFLRAWNEQFDVSFDETRYFIDAVERLGRDREEAVFTIPRSQLISAKYREAPVASAAVLVEAWSLKSRSKWRDVPAGFLKRDLDPWRYRRRLTVLRRPLIQLEETNDPVMMVAPGLIRDAFGYMLRGYRRGEFPSHQLKPLMSAWAGRAADEEGNKFSKEVADRLAELGWQTDTEVRITKLLRKSFDRDYGDVDVLAWDAKTGRVLIIECKDLQYKKAFGEIAEQLSDFRGEVRSDGKPDLLLKHLNRVALISQHLAELGSYIKLASVSTAESHLVFKNPVPMQFAWSHMEARVRLHVFSGLADI